MSRRRLSIGFSLIATTMLLSQTHRCIAASIPQTPVPSTATAISAEERGDAAMSQKDFLAAANDYSEAPTSAEVLNKRGVAYHHLQDLDLAMQNYQQALRMRPDYAEAINNLGAIYFSRGDYKQAIRLYKHALKIMPHSAIFAANLGTAYFARHQYEQGINSYRTAFKIDPNIFSSAARDIVTSASPADLAHVDYCIAELFAEAGLKSDAILYLRKSLHEGFRDRTRVLDDTAFTRIRQSAEFAQLVSQEKIHN